MQALSALTPAARYWVAYSGGLDSHVLLHALAALRERLPASVHAVHIDHGLQSAARHWSRHCAEVCAALNIPYLSLSVHAAPAPGESPEAAARAARYTALAALIEPGDCLLTAHHQDDQAETLLLQLLRGAGAHGLAAMPHCVGFGKGTHARPLLDYPRAALRAYAEHRHLHWVDDQSNLDSDFDRNYLRHEIMPRLYARWPAAARTLTRSASHAAQAAQLLDVLAEMDLHAVEIPPVPPLKKGGENKFPPLQKGSDTKSPPLKKGGGGGICLQKGSGEGILSITALRALDKTRQRNLLRHWLHLLNLPLPNAVHIDHIMHDIIDVAHDKISCVRWPGAELRRYRDLLYAMPPLAPHDPNARLAWDMQAPLTLPDATQLTATPTHGAGIKKSLLGGGAVSVCFRQGGERCKPAGKKHTRELKKLLQEQGIPPWQRERVPLIYIHDQLAAVGGLWVCQSFNAAQDEVGLQIERR